MAIPLVNAPYMPGEFIMHSESGEIRYLNIRDDSAFAEISKYVKQATESIDLPTPRYPLTQAIFGESACDLDSFGKPFEIRLNPNCPECGSKEIYSWEVVESSISVEAEVSMAPHER